MSWDEPDPLPSSHPLAGAEAKLRRAQENFVLIDDKIGAYLEAHPEPMPTLGRFDAATRHVLWDVSDYSEPDLALAAIIGDFVHDLRSALDHLAFELSFLDTGGVIPDRRIAYPCCRTQAEWKSKKVRVDKLRGINTTHRAMIRRTQPCYRRADKVTPATQRRRHRRVLGDLQDFWDHDKHRTLQPVVTFPGHIHGTIIRIEDCKPRGALHFAPDFRWQSLYRGMPVFWLPVWPTGPDPAVELHITVAVRISFRNGLPALHALSKIGDFVGNVLDFFAPVFETRNAKRLWDAPRGGWIDDAPLPVSPRVYRTAQTNGVHSVQAPSRP